MRRHRSVGRPLTVATAIAALLFAACSPRAEVAEPDEGPVPAEPSLEPAPPPAHQGELADPPPEPVDEEPEEDPGPVLGAYGVSAGDTAAVAAGMGILEEGGNAIDAAVATAFAVAVVEPFASGIGGGGAAVIAWPGEDPVAIDYREVVAQDGRIPGSNVGIPGFVAGMGELLEAHGTLGLAEVLEPAIALARDGSPTSQTLATQLRNSAHRLPVGRLPHLYPGGRALNAGEPLVQTELADTMERLAEHGTDDLYEGEIAATLSASIDGIDGASLAAYGVQRSSPASGSFGGYEVHAAAPPLPGTGLVQMLQVAEAMGAEDHRLGSADLIHTIVMAWRVADRSIASVLGDPDFVDVPVARLTDPERNAELAAEVPRDGLLATRPAPDQPPGQLTLATTATGPGNTTHLTVVDADGVMVSMTNTLTNFWGSGQYELGFFLNDQLRRFSIGGGSSNVPEPGRRSVSWSLPALVTDQEGRPVLGIGSPGGRRIPNVLTQVLVRWGLHGQSLEEAVAAPRFHLEGADLHVEQLPAGEVADELYARGYASISVPSPPLYFGSVQALEVDHEAGAVKGARDTRREADWDVGAP